MSGLICQQSQCGLGLGANAFAAYDLDRPITFDHLIVTVLASRVSVDFSETDLLQFFYRYQRLVSEGVEQPAYIKGLDPQWSLQHRVILPNSDRSWPS